MNLFPFGNHHGGHPWMTHGYAWILLAVSMVAIPLFSYRLFRDMRQRRHPDFADRPLIERLDVKDRLFGWIVALFLLMFVLAGAISRILH